jgi:hypothetical protein
MARAPLAPAPGLEKAGGLGTTVYIEREYGIAAELFEALLPRVRELGPRVHEQVLEDHDGPVVNLWRVPPRTALRQATSRLRSNARSRQFLRSGEFHPRRLAPVSQRTILYPVHCRDDDTDAQQHDQGEPHDEPAWLPGARWRHPNEGIRWVRRPHLRRLQGAATAAAPAAGIGPGVAAGGAAPLLPCSPPIGRHRSDAPELSAQQPDRRGQRAVPAGAA